MDVASHLGWARSLDAVLADRSALDAFQEWLDEFSSPQYLSLHFAIRAYERKWLEGNPEKTQLARSIYTTFLSSKTGNCKAIPGKYRAPIGERIKRGEELDEGAFSQCSAFVTDFLRKQHQQFVESDHFIEAFNKMTTSTSSSSDSSSSAAPLHHPNTTMERRRPSATTATAANHRRTQLTAEALLKSKHDRHTKLGETKLERMYPPTRQPYVCNPTTSHNDSAVSSSFSGGGDASSRAYNTRLRQVRDEQARENTGTFTVPRVERPEHRTHGVTSSSADQQFDHSSEPGRRHFAMEMTRKLLKHLDKIKMNDEMEKQINDIQEERYTTIDMVNCTDDNMSRVDEDEELDDYLKMKMTDDSQKGSAARSPKNKGGATASGSKEASKNATLSPPPPTSARDTPREVLLHPTIRPRRASNFKDSSFPLDVAMKPRHHHHHQIDVRMSQSMIGGGGAYSTTSSDTFAPSPLKSTWHHHQTTSGGSSKSSQMYDSSGIGSMAPSSFSATSSMDDSRDRRHHHQNQHHHSHSHSHQRRMASQSMSQSMTTPRKHHKIGKNLLSLITISYVGSDKVPVVAHVPNDGPMTLAEFKKHFALPPGAQQLFFKTECEDGSAPFQLLLIKDERHLLPIFENRIAAELR